MISQRFFFLIFVFVESVVLLPTLGDLLSAHTFASDSMELSRKNILQLPSHSQFKVTEFVFKLEWTTKQSSTME